MSGEFTRAFGSAAFMGVINVAVENFELWPAQQPPAAASAPAAAASPPADSNYGGEGSGNIGTVEAIIIGVVASFATVAAAAAGYMVKRARHRSKTSPAPEEYPGNRMSLRYYAQAVRDGLQPLSTDPYSAPRNTMLGCSMRLLVGGFPEEIVPLLPGQQPVETKVTKLRYSISGGV